jgi:hypothetical protein
MNIPIQYEGATYFGVISPGDFMVLTHFWDCLTIGDSTAPHGLEPQLPRKKTSDGWQNTRLETHPNAISGYISHISHYSLSHYLPCYPHVESFG